MKRMSASLITLLIFALLAVPLSAKDRQWQTGKVLDQENSQYQTYFEDVLHKVRGFAVESDRYIYVVSKETTGRASRGGLLPVPNVEDVLKGGHEVKLTVNGPVKFALDEKGRFYLLDENNRVHQMHVEKKILKDSPSKIVAGQDVATPQGGANADQSALITIDSGTPGSEIELDGAFVGNTPAKLRVTAGPHRIAVKSGRKVWEKNIQVLGGSAVTLQADLSQAGASALSAESTQEVSKTTVSSVSTDQHPTESDAQSGKKIEGATAYIACSESASEVPFSSSARSRKTLKCGEKVTILNRSGNWVRIRTADNVEGNVSARFLSQRSPASAE